MAPSKWAISIQVSGGIILTIFFYQLKKVQNVHFQPFPKRWLHFPLPANYRWIAKRKAMKAAIKIKGLIN